jgi:hypothetical protein
MREADGHAVTDDAENTGASLFADRSGGLKLVQMNRA